MKAFDNGSLWVTGLIIRQHAAEIAAKHALHLARCKVTGRKPHRVKMTRLAYVHAHQREHAGRWLN